MAKRQRKKAKQKETVDQIICNREIFLPRKLAINM